MTNIEISEKIKKKFLDEIKNKRKEYFETKEKEKEFRIAHFSIEERNDAFLLRENKIERCDSLKPLEPSHLKEEKIEIKEKKSEKFDISNIQIPDLKKPSNNTLNELIQYYNNCIKITKSLYFYIVSASKSNNDKRKSKATNYFWKLKSIKDKLEENTKNYYDYSFFSSDINELIRVFDDLCVKLEKIDFKTESNNSKKEGKDEESFLKLPEIKNINNNKDNWVTKKDIRNNEFNQENAELGNLQAKEVDKSFNEDDLFDENESEKQNENKNFIPKENKKINNDIDIRIIKIKDLDDDYNDLSNIFEDNDSEEKSEEENREENKEDKKINIKIGKKTDELTKIDPLKIGEINFKEEEGIIRALKDIAEEKKKKESNILPELDLGNPNKYYILTRSNMIIETKSQIDCNIKELYNSSRFLANQLFIKINGSSKVKYFDTLVIILIDPSAYISEEIKMINIFKCFKLFRNEIFYSTNGRRGI